MQSDHWVPKQLLQTNALAEEGNEMPTLTGNNLLQNICQRRTGPRDKFSTMEPPDSKMSGDMIRYFGWAFWVVTAIRISCRLLDRTQYTPHLLVRNCQTKRREQRSCLNA